MHVPEPIAGTVLVIDREDRLPKVRAALEAIGLTVQTATTAAEGLALAKANRPSLVVSEVMLEQPDAGFVLSYRMKRDPELQQVPVVLLSSIFQHTGTIFDLSTPESRQWIKADAYLEQPIAPDRLASKVRSLLQAPQSSLHRH